MRKPLVAITDSPAGDLGVEESVLRGMTVERIRWRDESSLAAALRDADAILCMHAPITHQVIQSLSRCRVIARFGTGLDNIDRSAAAAAGIPVAGVRDYCTEEVADHTLALLLSWHRKIGAYHAFVIEKRWNERTQTTGNWGCGPVARLSAQTLGLLGFGEIGRAVAKRATAFGMKVLAYSPRVRQDWLAANTVQATTREELLANADYVSLHLPLTPETRHMIDTAAIASMKPGAVLINTSRGGLIDEEALVSALRSGHLAGALLDVYATAPLPAEHGLRAQPNVILTPHVGFYSEDALLDLRRRAAETILTYVQEKT